MDIFENGHLSDAAKELDAQLANEGMMWGSNWGDELPSVDTTPIQRTQEQSGFLSIEQLHRPQTPNSLGHIGLQS
jgi:hypothetical protein